MRIVLEPRNWYARRDNSFQHNAGLFADRRDGVRAGPAGIWRGLLVRGVVDGRLPFESALIEQPAVLGVQAFLDPRFELRFVVVRFLEGILDRITSEPG